MSAKIPQPFAGELARSLLKVCNRVAAIKKSGHPGPWSELSIVLNTVQRALLLRKEAGILALASVAKNADKRQWRQVDPGNPAGPWLLARLQPEDFGRSEKLEALAGMVDTMTPYEGLKRALNDLPPFLPDEFKALPKERVELFAQQVLPEAEARREEGRDQFSRLSGELGLTAAQERKLAPWFEKLRLQQLGIGRRPSLAANADGRAIVKCAARILGASPAKADALFTAKRMKELRARKRILPES